MFRALQLQWTIPLYAADIIFFFADGWSIGERFYRWMFQFLGSIANYEIALVGLCPAIVYIVDNCFCAQLLARVYERS